jgi:hypothetical protein
MRYFTLIAASVSAQRNKIYFKENKDLIPENAWLPGKADELVLAGFIKEVVQEGVATSYEKKEYKITEVVKEIPLFVEEEEVKEEQANEDVKYNFSPIVEIGEITKDNIKSELIDNNIEFDANANKKALYDLWVSFAR